MSKVGQALVLVSLWAATAYGASNVSPRYDGVYAGTLAPLPWMSKPDCTEIPLRMEVKDGHFRRTALPAPGVAGFVTEDGFVTGQLYRAGSRTLTFEGRIVDGELSAGAIDEEAGCYWVATLAGEH